jgi:hypothetical protein
LVLLGNAVCLGGIGLAAGEPIRQATLRRGTKPLWRGRPVLMVSTMIAGSGDYLGAEGAAETTQASTHGA